MTSPSRSIRSADRAFTLIEMLVSMAVLVLLILMVTQIMNGATKTTGNSTQHLEADSEARMVFDRMAGDFARLVNRKDVDFLFINGANDQLFFFSEAPAVNAGMTDPQPVALIGYRINTDYQLERLGKGLTWGDPPPDGMVFLTYPVAGPPGPSPTPTPAPDPISTLKGGPFNSIISAASATQGSAYHVIGENVFRLEFSFLLKPFIPNGSTVQSPAVYSTTPYNGNHPDPAHQNGVGLSDVQAVVVTLALLDSKSRKLISSPSALASIVNGAFSGTADARELPAEKWQAGIKGIFGGGGGIPPVAAAQIRIYQRFFYLNSGNTN